MATDLLAHASGEALIVYTAYDSGEFGKEVRDHDMKPVIHPAPGRKKKPGLDRKLYGQRYLIEFFFHRLKRFRAIATR